MYNLKQIEMKNLEKYLVSSLNEKEQTAIEGGGKIGDLIDAINNGVRAYKRLKEFFSGRPQT